MTPGNVVAVGVAAVFVLGVAYGLSYDWLENRRWRRDEVRAGKRLAESEAEVLERMRLGVAFVEAVALQLAEIRELPSIEPNRRLTL